MSRHTDTTPVPLSMSSGDIWGTLPRLSRREVHLRSSLRTSLPAILAAVTRSMIVDKSLEGSIQVGPFEVSDRPSGLKRDQLVAILGWPRLASRLGLGLETPLVHALVDRLLGFQRAPGQEQLPVTPVEQGLMAFLVARSLERLAISQGPIAPEILLDHIGPEPFRLDGLGHVATIRLALGIGDTLGSLRVWIPEGLLFVSPEGSSCRGALPARGAPLRESVQGLTGWWRASAGTVTLRRGLGQLRVGGIQPIEGSPLRGTPASPEGSVSLILVEREGRHVLPARCQPLSGGGRLIVEGPRSFEPSPREGFVMSTNPPADSGSPHPSDREGSRTTSPSSATEAATPAFSEIPVTLAVELGRVQLSVERVADLQPGDVLTLNRHAREPVELTSGGKLVARGELVLIDTELGVRVTRVFL